MDNNAMKEVLNELFSHLERLETQNEAILQFLKEKKRVTDKQLAPYLEQAGNASNVKWRAARVRINHLLEPEHPEEEVKLGKRPELHEELSSAASSADRRAESAGEESRRTEPGDQKKIESKDKEAKKTASKNAEASNTDLSKKEKTAPAEAVQPRPTDGEANKPEAKSEVARKNAEQTTQDQPEQRPDSGGLHHPTEATEPLAEQEGAEPAAQLKPEKAGSGKEAA